MGLLSDGEIWLDDIRVIEDPEGAAIDLLQNGSFQEDAIGGEAGPGGSSATIGTAR